MKWLIMLMCPCCGQTCPVTVDAEACAADPNDVHIDLDHPLIDGWRASHLRPLAQPVRRVS
jgi:hypothetical protein